MWLNVKQRDCRIERGWDPVPAAYAETYGASEFAKSTEIAATVDLLEAWCGPVQAKRVLDLGAGPGHYSIELARRGALVTWHDPSRNYLKIAERNARDAAVELEYSLGLLEDSAKFGSASFDIVFNRICWNYCVADRPFARLIHDLLTPGGTAYIDLTNERFYEKAHGRRLPMRVAVASFLNRTCGIKLTYVHPPRGRLLKLMSSLPFQRLAVDYSRNRNDRILFTKVAGS